MDRSRATDRDEVERFLATLSDYQPTVPDALVTYYLSRAGFVTSDQRVIRLIGLAAQKFIADVGNDALAQARLRMAAESAGGRGGKAARQGAVATGLGVDTRVTLTTDDLEKALREYGVPLHKPPYYADSVTAGLPTDGGGPAKAPPTKGGAKGGGGASGH
ncbi:hypothetical protein BU14_0537s0014 [Porphyra umbilicalis]|uniref:Transcription initiation factor TFIID subunit 10 n=1 Tax=Porphyra umbilicalis TaxID=2786 RepID=A0A1X6NS44_PORUM|nr:hypothetical protein BU14_0537s0014 [Porphyra umbilicalis]|eukprot:OSX71408.1 hypothetical protein BU14_0537s0014 [Porphyra umbilicalis]